MRPKHKTGTTQPQPSQAPLAPHASSDTLAPFAGGRLVNGSIPAHTRCPYAVGCGGYREAWCLHKGYAEPTEYSCNIARAYDLINIMRSRKAERMRVRIQNETKKA